MHCGLLTMGACFAIPRLTCQTAQINAPTGDPIAIVPMDNRAPDAAATVTGALEVTRGATIIAANGTVTSASQMTRVILPRRGELRVCASSAIKLAADTSVPAGDSPGLLMAMDHGAVEMSFAMGGAAPQNADVLLTPDFRVLISGPGSTDVKVRLGQSGDTCVDNSGANGPYVLVSSIFDGGAYRVQPGQRVMFQHGSLNEVVDREKESCGCPPPATGNDFPIAQSEGLAPLPTPTPSVATETPATAQPVPPLVYKSADREAAQVDLPAHAPAPVTNVGPVAAKPKSKPKQGFFGRIGNFFRHIFGAEVEPEVCGGLLASPRGNFQGSRCYRLCARSMARMTACALLIDSRCSSSGTESATIPAPACTYPLPPTESMERMAMQESRLPEKSA